MWIRTDAGDGTEEVITRQVAKSRLTQVYWQKGRGRDEGAGGSHSVRLPRVPGMKFLRNNNRKIHTCLRCGWEWVPRDKERDPEICPKCKSANWATTVAK